ncbi:Uncharacterised protein [Niallia circulans]|nr:Uncharacterised protein [Niallia circulans]
MDFPIIHTNIWDGVIAIPAIVLFIQLIKLMTPIKHRYLPTLATIAGLLLSIFVSHRHSLSAGLFMGFLYGNGAVGLYASLKTAWLAFRKDNNRPDEYHPY